jgi:glutamate dehydrogenase
MSALSNSEQRKQSIDKIYQTASYCLNLKTEKDKNHVFSFLNDFFAMQGPEFFAQLNDDKQLKAYAGTICDLWKVFDTLNLKKNNNIVIDFFEHAYNKKVCFLSVITKDCDYIFKTFQHILKKNKIDYKNAIYPVIYTERNEKGQLLDIKGFQDGNTQISAEALAHFLILTPLSAAKKITLEEELFTSYQQLLKVDESAKLLKEKLAEMAHHFTEDSEEYSFLKWINQGRYDCYGYRYFSNSKGFKVDTSSHLGLLSVEYISDNKTLVPMTDDTTTQKTVNVFKSALRSNINRGSRYDCLEIPVYDQNSQLLGLHQFIGVFTPDFFSSPALTVPLASKKACAILDQFGYLKHGYGGKFLTHIMNSISLDLFFQLDKSEIVDLCQRVLEMQKNIVSYTKITPGNECAIVLIFMPAEKYSFRLKEQIKIYLEKIYNGYIYSEHMLIGEYSFARLLFVVDKDTAAKNDTDDSIVEGDINFLGETWEERLEHITDLESVEQISQIFPETYKRHFTPQQALTDFEALKDLNNKPYIFDLHPGDEYLKLHMFSKNGMAILSDVLPVLEKFGVQVFAETTYRLKAETYGNNVVLQVFEVHCRRDSGGIKLGDFKERFLNTLEAVWLKNAPNDQLNALVLLEELTHRELMLVRTFIKAQRQMGIQYSYDYIVDILCQHHVFCKRLCSFFSLKFDPLHHNFSNAKLYFEDLEEYCDSLQKLDDDRILRGLLNLIDASLRTNFYQQTALGLFKDYISIKFDSQKIIDLPKPRPMFEIFVYSMTVEGVHLRSGKVARGGIRWSDRLEDFRSEVLGLMKAQLVKNSVIIPFGSKGGFVVKNYEEAKAQGASSDILKNMVIENYKIFISALLDITDNFVKEKIIKPKNCICYDGDDHYLVVAADKGTATFSDVANGVSDEYGFWLSDAFASGGSYGYDHKKIAITARGAWVCVRRHFLEQNIDIQKDTINVMGVGDMAGDVFGNGMLLSPAMKLVGAFNHEHIFLDPYPEDAERSFAERLRLFKKPGSKWSDYDTALISKGGAVFRRDQKWVEISPEIAQVLDIPVVQLHPEELIQAMLKAPVDLLFFGGIGTFIKSSSESHLDAKDKANDVVRINGDEVRAKVIGEGANLGVTQKGRIEYAIYGGRINTDAVDNSAGVNCSDYEVNIKIFFNTLMQANVLSLSKRNEYLESMTDDVANLVLQNNHMQSFLLSVLEQSSKRYEKAYFQLMETMSQSEFLPLDVAIENLPSMQDLAKRKELHKGFTHPELAVIVAYSKLHLYKELLEHFDITECDKLLERYFPPLILEKYKNEITTHPLKREIICNHIANYIINHCGVLFIYSIAATSGLPQTSIVKVFLKIVEICDIHAIWKNLENITSLSAQDQYDTWHKIVNVLRQLILCYLRNYEFFETCTNQELMQHFSANATHRMMEDRQEFLTFVEGLYFYPLILESLAHLKNVTSFSLTELVNLYFRVKDMFDFNFLLTLTKVPSDAEEWERATQYLLNDDLLSKVVECMFFAKKYGTIDQWMEKKSEKFKNFLECKDIAKRHFQKDQNTIGLLSYMTKQMDYLMRD